MAYVASDNIGGGRMAARFMAEAIDGEGQVYVSNVRPGISTTDQREAGFMAEMAENYPNVEVLATQYNENDASLAASQFNAVMARNPDIKGVFGANLFSALGAGNGVESAGKADSVTVIAFDAPQSIVDNISTGLVDAAIAQHPAEIGYFGVMAAYAVLTGESVPTLIGTGFTVITADNVDDPDVAKFIYSE
ncbi:MAG: substrate-binding domain-containing protein, partial [Paracoccaceae bacterium]